jgi:hypothetical protein
MRGSAAAVLRADLLDEGARAFRELFQKKNHSCGQSAYTGLRKAPKTTFFYRFSVTFVTHVT